MGQPALVDILSALRLRRVCFRHCVGVLNTANNGHDALEILQRSAAIGVLFYNVIMPNMNGIELATHARSLRANMKILIASSYPFPALKAQHREIAEFSFMSKPYRLAEIAKNLRMT